MERIVMIPAEQMQEIRGMVRGGRWSPMLYVGNKPRRTGRVLRRELVDFIMKHNITKHFDVVLTPYEECFGRRSFRRWHVRAI
jgi:hypothetical protein